MWVQQAVVKGEEVEMKCYLQVVIKQEMSLSVIHI